MKKNNDHVNKVDLASPQVVAKDTSAANSSCRIYGAAAVGVPFVWESQPGTPKHPLSETPLPPLTPPPSYHTTPKRYSSSTMKRSNARAKAILDYIIPKAMKSRKNSIAVRTMSQPTDPPSASWSSSSSSSWSLNSFKGIEKRYDSVSRVPFGYDDEEDEDDDDVRRSTSSQISTMYNGIRRRGSEYLRRCNSMRKIKFAFTSIASHDN